MSRGYSSSRRPRFAYFAVILLLSGTAVSDTGERPLSAQEERGRRIYREGASPSGQEITAVFGKDATAVAASVLTCANCHGPDGRGKPEGGITPSDITWEALTKPYGISRAQGRSHPPYTEQFLRRAITMGIDPGGHHLNMTMPRYLISHGDLADLVAYLRRLGESLDPGLSDAAIRIGTILPSHRQIPDLGRAIAAVLTAYFDEVNSKGGIFNRRIDGKFLELPDSSEASLKALHSALESERTFALAGTFVAGIEQAVGTLLESQRMPLVGALTPDPSPSSPPNRYLFYLSAGLRSQSRALALFASQQFKGRSAGAAVIRSGESRMDELADAVTAEWRGAGWSSVDAVTMGAAPADVALQIEKLSRNGTEAVCFLGSGSAATAFLDHAERHGWNPAFYMPGALAGPEIFEAPSGFQGRIYLAFPMLPLDRNPLAEAEYSRLATSHKLPRQHLTLQLQALASAKILVEALTRAGRSVSRELLLEKLEGLYRFKTGFTPPISYNPNRRVGAIGAYLVAVDLKTRSFDRVSDWMELEELERP